MKMPRRPAGLAEVASRVAAEGDLQTHLGSFLDAFYARHGDLKAQAAFVAEEPLLTGVASDDAFIGGVAEHLARRWGLEIPAWCRDPRRYLDRALFSPNDKALRSYLICVSPVAFRSRLIFTGPDPLQRARFPQEAAVLRYPTTSGSPDAALAFPESLPRASPDAGDEMPVMEAGSSSSAR